MITRFLITCVIVSVILVPVLASCCGRAVDRVLPDSDNTASAASEDTSCPAEALCQLPCGDSGESVNDEPEDARRVDDQKAAELMNWIIAQDRNGWEVPGFTMEEPYTGIVVMRHSEHLQVKIAITADRVNPIHQRNILENIARVWRYQYDSGSEPEFPLQVSMYDTDFDEENLLGYTLINSEGVLSTYHNPTDGQN